MTAAKDKITLFEVAKKINWKGKIARTWKKWREFPLWHRHRRVLWPY